MQLRYVLIVLFVPMVVSGQYNKTLDETEVNILFNYYNQDGNHSPVTGGIGTEKLDCYSPVIMVNIPFDSARSMYIALGSDYYTSASSDRIDRFVSSASAQYLSSASAADLRTHLDVSYTIARPDKLFAYGLSAAFSGEFDVISAAAGFQISRISKNENTEFGLKGSYYHDIWKMIYPGEIRNGTTYRFGNYPTDYDTDVRKTATLSFSWMQVMNKKLHFLFLTDFVMQRGLLHTPFHRVYFDDGFDIPDSMLFIKTMFPENLPRLRTKLPMGIRVNYYLNDYLIVRAFYRHYTDDFGIRANTASIELPIKIYQWLTFYPHFRYHQQTASKYFAPFAKHPLNFNTWMPVSEFYTSDWDLAELINLKFGAGIRFYPFHSIAKLNINKNQIVFKSIELRYSRYNRNDGLKANSLSVDFGFKL